MYPFFKDSSANSENNSLKKHKVGITVLKVLKNVIKNKKTASSQVLHSSDSQIKSDIRSYFDQILEKLGNLSDRSVPSEQFKELRIFFEDGVKQLKYLLNHPYPQTLKINRIINVTIKKAKNFLDPSMPSKMFEELKTIIGNFDQFKFLKTDIELYALRAELMECCEKVKKLFEVSYLLSISPKEVEDFKIAVRKNLEQLNSFQDIQDLIKNLNETFKTSYTSDVCVDYFDNTLNNLILDTHMYVENLEEYHNFLLFKKEKQATHSNLGSKKLFNHILQCLSEVKMPSMCGRYDENWNNPFFRERLNYKIFQLQKKAEEYLRSLGSTEETIEMAKQITNELKQYKDSVSSYAVWQRVLANMLILVGVAVILSCLLVLLGIELLVSLTIGLMGAYIVFLINKNLTGHMTFFSRNKQERILNNIVQKIQKEFQPFQKKREEIKIKVLKAMQHDRSHEKMGLGEWPHLEIIEPSHLELR